MRSAEAMGHTPDVMSRLNAVVVVLVCNERGAIANELVTEPGCQRRWTPGALGRRPARGIAIRLAVDGACRACRLDLSVRAS